MSKHRCKCGCKRKLCKAGKDGSGLFCPNCGRSLAPPRGYKDIDWSFFGISAAERASFRSSALLSLFLESL